MEHTVGTYLASEKYIALRHGDNGDIAMVFEIDSTSNPMETILRLVYTGPWETALQLNFPGYVQQG